MIACLKFAKLLIIAVIMLIVHDTDLMPITLPGPTGEANEHVYNRAV